jgi:hypothetical protein
MAGVCAKPAAIAIHPQPLLTAVESEFETSRPPATNTQNPNPHRLGFFCPFPKCWRGFRGGRLWLAAPEAVATESRAATKKPPAGGCWRWVRRAQPGGASTRILSPQSFGQGLRITFSSTASGEPTSLSTTSGVRSVSREKWLHSLGQFFLGINKVTALRFQAAIAAPVLLK